MPSNLVKLTLLKCNTEILKCPNLKYLHLDINIKEINCPLVNSIIFDSILIIHENNIINGLCFDVEILHFKNMYVRELNLKNTKKIYLTKSTIKTLISDATVIELK